MGNRAAVPAATRSAAGKHLRRRIAVGGVNAVNVPGLCYTYYGDGWHWQRIKGVNEKQPKLDFPTALAWIAGGMVLGWALWKLWSGF